MDYNKLGWIKSSTHRIRILKLLKDKPMTPKEIAQAIPLNLSNVSNYLSDLKDKGIVICLNNGLRKGRLYSISNLGKEALNKI